MDIAKLNQLREQNHKQFVNRLPYDSSAVLFLIGVGEEGVTEADAKLLKTFAEKIAEVSNDARVMFDPSFKGVKTVKDGVEEMQEVACEKCVDKLIKKYLA